MNNQNHLRITLILILMIMAACTGSSLSPEEVETKWRSPIMMASFNAGICETTTETAVNVNSGQIDGFTAFGELLGAGMMIQAVDETLQEAEPAPDQDQLYGRLQTDVTALREIVGPWVNQETSSTEVLETIDETCDQINQTLTQTLEAAEKDGLTEAQLKEWMAEMAATMDAAFETTE